MFSVTYIQYIRNFEQLLIVEMETKTKSSKSEEKHSHDDSSDGSILENNNRKNRKRMMIEGYPIEGLSIAGHETCIILPTLNLAFDIGRCPSRAISQQFLFISHGHMDHIVSNSDFPVLLVHTYIFSSGYVILKSNIVV